MQDISRARRRKARLEGPASQIAKVLDKLEEVNAVAASDVKHAPGDTFCGSLGRRQIRRDHILDVGEIPG